MEMMNYNAGTGTCKNWIVEERAFDTRYLGKCEAIFCQGNGYIGQRAALEERYVGETRDLLVTGTFNKFDENEVTELPNLPDLTNLSLTVNGLRFSMDTGKLHGYSRRLNLKNGELTREVDWESPAGDRLKLVFRRFVSLADEHLLGIRADITPMNRNVTVKIESGIDGRMTNTGSQHFHEGAKRLYDNRILQMCSQTTQSGVWCCLHTVNSFLIDGSAVDLPLLPIIDRRYLSNRAEAAVEPGHTLTVEKISCVHTSRDMAYDGCADDAAARIRQDGMAAIRAAYPRGYEALAAESFGAWEKLWNEIDIQIGTEKGYDQLAIRFALYHLNIMVKKDDSRVGIGAKALSGEGYKGHSFWDTEIFILPYFTLTQPETARTLLEYRYKNLYGARLKARENGYEGAMYPWESAWIDDGEVTPLWGAADVVTGLPMKILTGMIEQHISSDIAFAVWQYYTATGDQDFLDRCGYEIVIDTARFWASRVEWSEDKQAYVIHDVIGPDEYKEHVNNNAYTNYMAQYNMELALRMMDTLEQSKNEVWQRLHEKLDFAGSRAKIKKAAQKIFLPQPNEDGIVAQFEGYFDLAHIDLTKYKESSVVGTIYNDYNIEQISGFQVAKQSDLVMLLFLRDDLFERGIKRKNYEYYEARTLHDSSLSKSTHSVLASDLGDRKTAYKFFEGACSIDLGPTMTTSDMGIHSASMGGIWQCVVYGFGGVRIVGAELHIAPELPEAWDSLSFRLCWQGCPMRIFADQAGVRITNDGARPVCARVYGMARTVAPGETADIAKA